MIPCPETRRHHMFWSWENDFPTDKPRPVLTVSPSWLSPGASVTLKCEVEHPSAGWRFSWYKAVPDVSHTSYSYELLPGRSSGTEQDSYIVHGQTHTAGYVCEAGRGDPVFYTEISEPKFVWSGGEFVVSLVFLRQEANVQSWPEFIHVFVCEQLFLKTNVGKQTDFYVHGPQWKKCYDCELGWVSFSPCFLLSFPYPSSVNLKALKPTNKHGDTRFPPLTEVQLHSSQWVLLFWKLPVYRQDSYSCSLHSVVRQVHRPEKQTAVKLRRLKQDK